MNRRINNFWNELKRRHVFRVATVYAVASWLTLQVASTIIAPLHLPEWVITFLIVLVIVGFPIALILAWAYELTPANGVEKIPDQDQQGKHFGGIVLKVGTMVIVIAGLASFFYFTRESSQPIHAKKENTIAVLPFDNLTGDKEQDFFTDGIVEEILNHLTRIEEFNVTSRTSSMSFKENRPPAKEIAEKLGVNYLLEGSLRKQGDQVRITVQFIDATTDTHLLSEEYDRVYSLNDLFAIQTEISMRIARLLQVTLSREEQVSLSKVNTESTQAYKLYLRGRNFWDKRTRASYDSAESCYKKALEIDPQYALAYAGLADCFLTNQKGLAQTEAIPIARAYAEKALAIDSMLCEAITAIGFIQGLYEYEWKRSIDTFQKAISCNPSYPTSHQYLGVVYMADGQEQKGFDEIRKALAIDPLSPTINHVLGRSYFAARKYELAITQLKKTLDIEPKYLRSKIYLARAYAQLKQYDKALSAMSGLEQLNETPPMAVLSSIYSAMGDREHALKAFQQIPANHPSKAGGQALALAGMGRDQEAIDNLEIAYSRREITMLDIAHSPEWDRLRDEPRLKELLRRMNQE